MDAEVIEALTAGEEVEEHARAAKEAHEKHWRPVLENLAALRAAASKRSYANAHLSLPELAATLESTEPTDVAPEPAPEPEPAQVPEPAPTPRPAVPQSEPAMSGMTLEQYRRFMAIAEGESDFLGRSHVSGGGSYDPLQDIEKMLAQLDDSVDGKEALAESSNIDDTEPSRNVSHAEEPSKIVSNDEELSKTVSVPASKIVSDADTTPPKTVSEDGLRLFANDEKTIAKMRSFRLSDVSPTPTSSVSYPPSSLSSVTKPTTATEPANENHCIPVWSRTGELVTAVCAAAALLIDDHPPIAFTFNLTRNAISKAKRDPNGFLDALKRPFDQNLKRAGVTLPYFFAVDIDDDGRLHLHGGFRYPAPTISISLTRRIRTIMKDSWGEWAGPGKHKQLRFEALYSDDWATYCLRRTKEVQKIVGPRTFTITHSLGRDARWVYGQTRSIMRGEM
jgi:hypothetical protein